MRRSANRLDLERPAAPPHNVPLGDATERMRILMKPIFRIAVLALMLGVLATACATPNPTPRQPQITFQHIGAVNLAVSRIEVVDGYRSPLQAPNVEHKMSTKPAEALRIWANDRLKAVGGPNDPVARFVIDSARMTEEALPRTEGIKGVFTKDQAFRYHLDLAAAIEIVDARGGRTGHANTRATHSQSTPESVTLNELHQTWFKVLEAGMADFDKEMELNIRKYLVNWLR